MQCARYIGKHGKSVRLLPALDTKYSFRERVYPRPVNRLFDFIQPLFLNIDVRFVDAGCEGPVQPPDKSALYSSVFLLGVIDYSELVVFI